MQVILAVCHVMCLLSGDHASCRSYLQYVIIRMRLLSGDHASYGLCLQHVI